MCSIILDKTGKRSKVAPLKIGGSFIVDLRLSEKKTFW